jgi:hypothetical protein
VYHSFRGYTSRLTGLDGRGRGLLDGLLGLPASDADEQLVRDHLEAAVGGDSGEADADHLGGGGDLGRVLVHDVGEGGVGGGEVGHDCVTFQLGLGLIIGQVFLAMLCPANHCNNLTSHPFLVTEFDYRKNLSPSPWGLGDFTTDVDYFVLFH